jgi:hypothetical protein
VLLFDAFVNLGQLTSDRENSVGQFVERLSENSVGRFVVERFASHRPVVALDLRHSLATTFGLFKRKNANSAGVLLKEKTSMKKPLKTDEKPF